MWAVLLGVNVVSPDNDFFELGGNSLLAARLVLQVREAYNVEVPHLRAVRLGTLKDFAAVVRKARRGVVDHRAAAEGPRYGAPTGSYPPTCASTSNGARAAKSSSKGRARWTALCSTAGPASSGRSWCATCSRAPARASAALSARPTRRTAPAARVWGAGEIRAVEEAFADRIRRPLGFWAAQVRALRGRVSEQLAASVDLIIHSGAQGELCPAVRGASADERSWARPRCCASPPLAEESRCTMLSTIAVFGPSGYLGGNNEVRTKTSTRTRATSSSIPVTPRASGSRRSWCGGGANGPTGGGAPSRLYYGRYPDGGGQRGRFPSAARCGASSRWGRTRICRANARSSCRWTT